MWFYSPPPSYKKENALFNKDIKEILLGGKKRKKEERIEEI